MNVDGLEWYVVGGAVRDILRGEQPKDCDFVVVGSSPGEMKKRGFEPVPASSFPVFINPTTGNEWALARRERKSGDGYHGFEWDTGDVSLEEDLQRRDFTINAMAFDPREQTIIDPHGGKHDLEMGALQHVDEEHFSEDPLRILRGARFVARFGFIILPSTAALMGETRHELADIPRERVGEELVKAMMEAELPDHFIGTLWRIRALGQLDPLLAEAEGIPAGPKEYHEETLLEHLIYTVREGHEIRPNDPDFLLACLYHDIGKVLTPDEDLPSHPGHDQRGAEYIGDNFQELYKLSNRTTRKVQTAAREHMRMMDLPKMRPTKAVRLVEELDSVPGADADWYLDLLEADAAAHVPPKTVPTTELEDCVRAAREATGTVDAEYVVVEKRGKSIGDYSGEAIGQMILQERGSFYARRRHEQEANAK